MIVSNPSNRNRRWEGQFLVDTDATDSLVPRQHLEAIGVRPEAQRTYVLVDGSEIQHGHCRRPNRTHGRNSGEYRTIRRRKGGAALLGVTALESLGIEIDPLNQQLKKLPAVRLKNLRTILDNSNTAPTQFKVDRQSNMKIFNVQVRRKTINPRQPQRMHDERATG